MTVFCCAFKRSVMVRLLTATGCATADGCAPGMADVGLHLMQCTKQRAISVSRWDSDLLRPERAACADAVFDTFQALKDLGYPGVDIYVGGPCLACASLPKCSELMQESFIIQMKT